MNMKKKHVYISVSAMGLAMVVLSACSNAQTSEPETYKINPTSMGRGAKQDNQDSEYEISDMLPRPSDDTLIISVEEAEAIMNNRANATVDEDTETE